MHSSHHFTALQRYDRSVTNLKKKIRQLSTSLRALCFSPTKIQILRFRWGGSQNAARFPFITRNEHTPHALVFRIAVSKCSRAMGRRPRSHHPSGSATSLHYGITTIFVAGLAFVDSFSLLVHQQHQHHQQQHSSSGTNSRSCLSHSSRTQLQQQQQHVRYSSFRGQVCSSCSASPRNSSTPGGSSSRRRAITAVTEEDGRGTTTRKQSTTPCVTTRTRSTAAKLAIPAAAAAPPLPPADGKGVHGVEGSATSRRRRRSRGEVAPDNEGIKARRKTAMERKQKKQHLQRSIDGVGDRAMSRGQLVGSFALMGTAAALLGASGTASASTEVGS